MEKEKYNKVVYKIPKGKWVNVSGGFYHNEEEAHQVAAEKGLKVFKRSREKLYSVGELA